MLGLAASWLLAGSAVARVVAEKAAGQLTGGSVDLIWINGENFAANPPALVARLSVAGGHAAPSNMSSDWLTSPLPVFYLRIEYSCSALRSARWRLEASGPFQGRLS